MGKNHKHLKKVKSEKGKVKLRVKTEKTKFLPKGLNVTKTDFKIKPIVIPEQLKYTTAQPHVPRKLNIKDVLSKLQHHNLSIRLTCLEDLRHYLQDQFEEDASQYLPHILNSFLALILDSEQKIRHNVIKLCNDFVFKIPEYKMLPFYGVVSAYLRCAMTHINSSVQEDSIVFLNVIINRMPGFVRQEYTRMLPNIFSLISKLKNNSKVPMLTVNLKSKITSIKWRIQVLSTLYRILKAVTDSLNTQNDRRSNSLFQTKRYLYYNPYEAKKIEFSFNNKEKSTEINEDALIKSLGTLGTLLYESWLEVCPDKDFTHDVKEATVLVPDSAAILSSILNTLHLTWKYLIMHTGDDKLLLTANCKKLMEHIIGGFPYNVQSVTSVKKRSKIGKLLLNFNEDDYKMTKENLLVCHFVTIYQKKCFGDEDILKTTKYLTDCLSRRGAISESNIDNLLEIIDANIRKCSINDESLIIKFLDFCEMWIKTKSITSGKILDILSRIIELSFIQSNEKFHLWISKQPKVLYKSQISEKMLDLLLKLAKQGNKTFLLNLQGSMDKILENFEDLQVVDAFEEQNLSKRKILHMFCHIEQWNDDNFLRFVNFVENSPEAHTIRTIFPKYPSNISK